MLLKNVLSRQGHTSLSYSYGFKLGNYVLGVEIPNLLLGEGGIHR